MIELAWPAAEEGSILPLTWLGWVKMLSDDQVRARPALNVWYAFALLGSGEVEAADIRLMDTERRLEAAEGVKVHQKSPSDGLAIMDKSQIQTLQAAICIGRAYVAQALGDFPNTVRFAYRALELASEKDHLRRGQASMLLGMSHWASGDLETARQVFADYTMILRKSGNIPDAISTTAVLADISLALGHLREAIAAVERCLHFVSEQGEPIPPETADLYRELSELYLEQGDLDTAARLLQRGEELGEKAEPSVLRYRMCIARARFNKTQADLDGAFVSLDEAEQLYIRSPLPDFSPISAMKVRIWIAQGRLDESLRWGRDRNLSVDDAPGYLREYEQITLARILIAQYQGNRLEGTIHTVMCFLDLLLQAAEEGSRMYSMIEILALRALAYQAQGKMAPALVQLEHALALASPEGYVRIFTDEGPPMEQLIQEAFSRGIAPTYSRRLLTAFLFVGAKQSMTAKSAQPEHLSQREVEVLCHIAQGWSNREIAARLYLSLNTVKVHTRNIFGKLDVNNRTQAVAKAREMGILPILNTVARR